MSAHDTEMCGLQEFPVRIYTVGGERQSILIHPCCPKCGRRVAERRWGDMRFMVVGFGSGEVEAQSVIGLSADCTKCGAVELGTEYSE